MTDLKCSFCLSEEDDRKYLTSDDGTACVCSNCAMMLTQYVLQEREEESKESQSSNNEAESVSEDDKNIKFQDYLVSLEDKWMEKNVINSYVLDAGGSINLVTFRFEDEDDGFYFICELEVEGIDELPDDVEENILNEIEWAFDEIRSDLESEGLDLETYLGEKVITKRADEDEANVESAPKLDSLCDAISDKLMETGYLTSAIENGDLATITIKVEEFNEFFKIVIYLQVDSRSTEKLSPDEEENICDNFDTFINERGLRGSLAALGFDTEGDSFDGYYAKLMVSDAQDYDNSHQTSDSNLKKENKPMKKLTDDQKNDLLADIEDNLNESGAWVEYIANCGGEIAFVQLDIEQDDDGGWRFIARVVTEEKIVLSKEAEASMLDDLEVIADNMYGRFEEFGLDPQDRVGMKVLVIADSEQ